MDRPLPSSLSFTSDFFDDGINKFDRRRDFRDVVGVDEGVGSSLVSLEFGTDEVFRDCNELKAANGALIRSFGCCEIPCDLIELQFLPGDPCN